MASSRQTTVTQRTNTMHRVSIGLIAISISLISLALGTALFLSPSANFLFVPTGGANVSLSASSATSVTVTWTAPGDDGNVGQATSYNLRYSTSPITSGNFDSALPVAGAPVPATAGTTESYTVTGLQPSTTYFLALKTTDDAGNVSAMSNVASKTTDAIAAACTPTHTCSEWSACAGGQMTRTCTVTNGCQSGLDAPITTQACTVATTAPTGGEPVHVVNPIIVAGLGPGHTPSIRVIDPKTRKVTKEIRPFSSRDRNGINVAAGDVNGDSNADIVAGTGAGSNALVQVHTPRGVMLYRFNPYPTDRGTGVSVAVADVDGDGIDDIITVPAKGLSQVRIWKFDSATGRFTQLAQRVAFDTRSRQGFTVAAGDLNLDGRAEIVVAPRENGRSVLIMNLNTSKKIVDVKRFTPYPTQFRTGITISVGDIFGTGRAMVVTTPGPKYYYSDIKVFDVNGRQQTNFLAISRSYRNGLSLATQDVNSDGRVDIITGSYGNQSGQIRIYRYDGIKKRFLLLQSYYPFSRSIRTGLRLGAS